MVLPLSLLRCAVGHPIMIELKSGETYNGTLDSCDAWMNVNISKVICTSKDGQKFWKLRECYIRGHTIKLLTIADEVLSAVKDEDSDIKAARRKPRDMRHPGMAMHTKMGSKPMYKKRRTGGGPP